MSGIVHKSEECLGERPQESIYKIRIECEVVFVGKLHPSSRTVLCLEKVRVESEWSDLMLIFSA